MEIENMPSSKCLPLKAISSEAVGGKAKGLSHLMHLGLSVPDGFVIMGATKEGLPADLSKYYEPFKKDRLAVRSSALSEDAEDTSFAGQYDTLLNVEGYKGLEEAVLTCLNSLETDRALAYQKSHHRQKETHMSVVVQKMVDAKSAGVLFTADPVTGRKDLIVIDSIRGLGERLVSGLEEPDHHVYSKNGELITKKIAKENQILHKEQLELLIKEALMVEKAKGMPLDMEWAFDKNGKLFWLQARPITTLKGDPTELDTIPGLDSDVHTTCNVGEILPGPITPLTFSFVIGAMEIGMQRQHMAVGLMDKESKEHVICGQRLGHLFLNLTKTCEIGANILGASIENTCLALCGRPIPQVKLAAKIPFYKKVIGSYKFFRYILSGASYLERMEDLTKNLHLPLSENAENLYQQIHQNFKTYADIFDCHVTVTSQAGFYEPILMQILSKGKTIKDEHHAQLASWLSGAEDVESADIACGLERILDKLEAIPHEENPFLELEDKKALSWLESRASCEAEKEFSDYLKRHGHRALRELELRQEEWQKDPLPIVRSLQNAFSARNKGLGTRISADKKDLKTAPPLLRFFIKKIHQAIRRRERSKSLLIKSTVIFKKGYRALARLLVEEGKIPEKDCIFFLTHKEVGMMVRGEDVNRLSQKALERRQVLEQQKNLTLSDIFIGNKEPTLQKEQIDIKEGTLKGTPANCGVIVGKARVVTRLEDARHIEPGEILITTVTDVGWTPYFSLISGLAADIGSSVSHGAVVAREYGLPAVVGLKTATLAFKTGDIVELDGSRGTLSLKVT